MLKSIDVKVKSISDSKKNFSKIIKEVNETKEPVFVFNHNKPEAVICSYEVYDELVQRFKVMEEQLFYSKLNNRVDAGPGEMIPAGTVVNKDLSHNPFADLADEELFD